MNRSRCICLSSTVGLSIGVIGLIVVSTLYIITKHSTDMYSVVLDAGSSSTKINVFQFKDNAARTNAEVELLALKKVDGGISDYVDKPFEAYKKMEPTFKELIAKIPASKRPDTPVYLAATAGMRLALLRNPLGSMKLFEVLRRDLLSSGLYVETPNERIRMLSGAEEGLYGWVSVNSILDLITSDTQVDPSETVGSLDLGGASTQIAFASDKSPPNKAASIDYYPLKLFDKEYHVYSHSYLCYGKNEFERRLKAAVIANQTSGEIHHPCFPAGYNKSGEAVNDIFDSPCVTGAFADGSFAADLTKPKGHSSITFIGTGNAAECKKIIEAQFNTGACAVAPCALNGVYQPGVQGEFRAYSGYSFVMAYLFKNKATGFTISEVENAVKTFCGRPWEQLRKESDSKFTVKYCFDGYYVLALLRHLGFNTDEKFRKITFGSKINGATVSWAQGYMLDQSGCLPSKIPRIYLPLVLFATLIAIFILTTLLSILGLIYAIRLSMHEAYAAEP